VEENDTICLRQVIIGPETEIRVLFLSCRIYPSSFIATERFLFVIVGHDVLTKLRTNPFDEVPQAANQREVSQYGMPALDKVIQG
jgi:hypothetical protein|tara:strand:+ start:375 stop:629 length:255 start_codon:yes stop_codon:yes gene_type:complete